MAKVRIKVGKDAVKQAQESGDFEEAPPGVYLAELKECNPGYAKGEDGKPDESRPYLECIYRILGDRDGNKLDKNYGQVWDYVSFSESAEWKMAQFGLAMGLKLKKGALNEEIELDPAKPKTVIGTNVLLRVKKGDDGSGNYRAKTGSVLPADGGPALPDDDEDEGDAFEEEEEAADPFEEGDEGDEDYLTEEDLEGMENKELGGVAKDFDLEPRDYLGKRKGKTIVKRKDLIAAILEAQGAPDDDDIDPGEDPF